MRVVNVTLPVLATVLSVGLGNAAWAGPASALDPYSYIQAPTKEERQAAIDKRNKKSKKSSTEMAATSEPLHRSAQNDAMGIAGPFDVVLDGMKQSSAGLGKGAKAAGSKIASGTAGMFKGTGKLLKIGGKNESAAAAGKVAAATPAAAASSAHGATPAKLADAAKPAPAKKAGGGSVIGGLGEKFSGMNKAVAGGFKSAGGAMKAGTVTVASGFKAAGGKLVDGTQAAGAKVASLPKAIGIGGGAKTPKSTEIAAKGAATTPVANASAAPATADSVAAAPGTEGWLNPAAPQTTTVSAPKHGAVAGLGGAAKKLASAPKAGFVAIGHGFGKLNPFGRDSKTAAPTATASSPGAVPQ